MPRMLGMLQRNARFGGKYTGFTVDGVLSALSDSPTTPAQRLSETFGGGTVPKLCP